MHGRVTIGIVGAGFGQQVHVPAFRNLPGCEVRAICARHRERAEQAAQALGIPRATDDWRELVADPEINALALAVPPSVQVMIADAAARAGKHLFCEKPLALNASQARDLLAVAQRSKIVHAMDFIFPEIAAWRTAREVIHAATLGRIRHVALTWRVETYAYRASAHNWKTLADSGGGTLNNFGSHTMHYLEWLFGSVDRLGGYLAPRGAGVEARMDAWIEFSAGFSGSVSIAEDAFLGPGHRLEVYGDSGTLLLENDTKDYARGFKLFIGTRKEPRLAALEVLDDQSSDDGRVAPVSRIAGRFVEAILSGGQVSPSLSEGTRVQALLDTLRLAHQTGTWQEVGTA